MKKHLPHYAVLFCFILFLGAGLQAQNVAINNDGSNPDPSAMLDIKAESMGLLIPRIIEANRPATPATGLLIYQTDNDPGFYYYDGIKWQKVENFEQLETLLQTETIARENADSGLQTELDGTQAGAGLGTDGIYTANGSANYISDASTLQNADNKLDAQMKTNAGDISTNADGVANNVTDISSNDGDISNIQTKMTSDSTAIQAELDATQSGAGLGTDGIYTANGSANYISGASTLQNADNKLDAQIKTNTTNISSNVTDIAANTSNINSNDGDISNIQTKMYSDSTAIQAELDATQSGAGLGTDGIYTANGSANYISDATTLQDADNKLDAQMKTNTTNISSNDTDIGNLQTTVSGLGSMANQNSTNVAITGGAIDGTAIGANSASTAEFTTVSMSGLEVANAITSTTLTVTQGARSGKVLTSDATGNASWQTPAPITSIQDADNNTKIQVEKTPNDNIIRFDIDGKEKWIMTESRLEPQHTGGSVFIGDSAGAHDNLTNNKNIFIGYQSGYSNTGGSYNIFSGYLSGYKNIGGSNNIFSGSHSGYSNISGYNNIFSGYYSGNSNTYGYYNIFSGFQSGYSNTTGSNNIFSGNSSGYSNTSGSNNIFSGNASGISNTEGNNNVYLGDLSGYYNETGSGNVFLGNMAGYWETGSNKLYINSSQSFGSSPLIYGDFSEKTLTFNGTVQITGGDPGEGKVLTSDVCGNATWQIARTSPKSGGSAESSLIKIKENTVLQAEHSATVLIYGNTTISLPDPGTAAGIVFIIKKKDGQEYKASIIGSIDGKSNITLNHKYQYITIVSDGEEWLKTSESQYSTAQPTVPQEASILNN